MTDLQLIEAAEKLVKSSDVKQHLGPNHSLAELWKAAKVVQLAGIALVEQHGDRLSKLEPVLYRDLAGWKDLAI